MSPKSIFKSIRLFLVLPLLGIISWQQWKTFSNYQDKFSNPTEYIKKAQQIDDIGGYKTKLEPIRKMFSGEAKVTYVSETVYPNAATREMHFALTQYELAPNLLFRNNLTPDSIEFDSGASPVTYSSVVCDTVLYNLFSSYAINRSNNYYLNNGYHIVKDFGNGFIVLAK